MYGDTVPNLIATPCDPAHDIEQIILKQVAVIESWFRQKWKDTPASLTSSVDLRHAGFKLAPIDTNLFPAGFNNLSRDCLPLCIQAVQAVLDDYNPTCKNILILPESHTRNQFYMQNLSVLRDIFVKAGFVVRIGSLDPTVHDAVKIMLDEGDELLIEPLLRRGDHLELPGFVPCIVLLNNDLSSGVPDILKGIKQRIRPTAELGWSSRLKSNHFHFFDEVAVEFSQLMGIDPWLINPYFDAVDQVDFMAKTGLESLAEQVDVLLAKISKQYKTYGIKEKPFVAIKADNGTYGMSVMMVENAQELYQLNRKQRSRMATSKGNRKVDRVLIQEGVYTFETMPSGAVAEPVVYMIGQFVVGGFYRVHQERERNENLNTPGMHFEPLAFTQACNLPRFPSVQKHADSPLNRFYVYGVVARLAALAAAREIAAVGGES